MSKISKAVFKKKVKHGAKIETINYLIGLKNKHSKLENISVSGELSAQEYFSDTRLNPTEVKLLFKLRTRMFNCKNNFKNRWQEDIWCKLCRIFVDCQSHLMQCPILVACVPELRQNSTIKYEDIFLSVDYQVRAIKLLAKVIDCRELLLNR